MNRRQKIIVSITGIFLVLLILVGLTYAYFLTRINGNDNEKSISVTTVNLELTYGDGTNKVLTTTDPIIPSNDPIGTKDFTVTNNGNATVNNYAVYLEDIENKLTRTSDLVYTLTCTSSVQNKTCNGKSETVYPNKNGILVTNNIDKDEVQTYVLTLTYKEMNEDQSTDMNKTINGKIQIYNLKDIVDIEGTVTNALTTDYVQINSVEKKSQIINGEYKLPAVEPGTHTIRVFDKDGAEKSSRQITIQKGKAASVSGNTITITNDSQVISMNLDRATTSSDSISSDVVQFETGTLANKIYTSAVNNTDSNRSTYRDKPLSSPNKTNYATSSDGGMYGSETNVTIGYSNALSYATGYTYNTSTHKYTLTGITSGYAYDFVYKGYVESTSLGSTLTKTTDLDTIYEINFTDGDSNNLIYTLKPKYNYSITDEKTLSKTEDNYGNAYYFRGNVKDNYVNFADMCWRIMYIQGNKTVKLILDDEKHTCDSSSYDNANALINDGQLEYNGSYDSTYESWMNSKINSAYKNMLASNAYCSDREERTCEKNEIPSDGTITSIACYNSLKRETPSLKCNSKNNVYSKISNITTDEAYLAGVNHKMDGLSYLNINRSDFHYHTSNLNYQYFLEEAATWLEDFIIISDNKIDSMESPDLPSSLRPTIVLNYGITATGTGTQTDPYVIQ